MSSPLYDSLTRAINLYKAAIHETLVDLRRSFILDLVFIVIIPVILGVVALIFAGFAGLLTTLGLGGINAEERFRRGQTILKSYWGERSKLKKSVQRLEFELALCGSSDTVCLQEIENLLRAYFDALP